jgi:rod shape-determining protein MreB
LAAAFALFPEQGICLTMFGFNFFSSDVAIAIGGDRIWLADGATGPVTGMPAYVAQTGGKVCAAGEEARRLLGKEPANLSVIRISNQGGFGDTTLSIAFIRYLLAKGRGVRSLPPRVVVACSQAAKLGVMDVLTKGGARKVITIPPAMSAAIGAGLPIDTPAFQAVFCLERDWCSFAVISLNGIVAAFELAGGIELLLEDIAIHALATRGVALDMEKLHDALLSRGIVGSDLLGWEAWIGELETGRAAVVSASDNDFRRSAIPFTLRLDRRCRQAMETVESAKRRDAAGSPIHLFGPYAKLPGVADLISQAFSRKIVVPDKPEEAMVRGGQKVLADLKWLMKGAK